MISDILDIRLDKPTFLPALVDRNSVSVLFRPLGTSDNSTEDTSGASHDETALNLMGWKAWVFLRPTAD